VSLTATLPPLGELTLSSFAGGEKQGSNLGPRSRKRSVDDVYDWYEDVTPSKRRASIDSASATASEGMASATRSASTAGIEEEQDPDYRPTYITNTSSSPTALTQEDTLSKRPWQPAEDSLLIALKTGATTKRRSYAQLVEHFPGRGAPSIAARWGKIKGKLETRKEIGANKRRARDESRDRTIQATLTGPPRLTWASFEKRMREREVIDADVVEESEDDEGGELGVRFRRSLLIFSFPADEESLPAPEAASRSRAPQHAQAPSQPSQLVTRIDQLLNKSDEKVASPSTFEAEDGETDLSERKDGPPAHPIGACSSFLARAVSGSAAAPKRDRFRFEFHD